MTKMTTNKSATTFTGIELTAPTPPQPEIEFYSISDQEESPVIDDINRFQECLVTINPSFTHAPKSKLRKCSLTKKLKQGCQNDPNSFCHLYQGAFDGYKNIHCHQCNASEIFHPNKLIMCREAFDRYFTWRTTISFQDDTTSVEVMDQWTLTKQQKRCSYGEIYNLFKDTCRKIDCAPGYSFKDNICVKDSQIIIPKDQNITNQSGQGFVKCLTSRPVYLYLVVLNNTLRETNLINHLQDAFNNLGLIEDNFTLIQNEISGHIMTVLKTSYKTFKENKTLTMEDILNDFDLLPSIWKNVAEIYLSSSDTIEVTPLYGFDPSRYFSSHRLCSFKHDLNMTETNFTNTCQQQQQSNETNNNDELSFTIRINQTSHDIITSKCSIFHLHSSCPVIKINENLITISQIQKNVSFIHKGKHYHFEPLQYLPTGDGGIKVCTINMDPYKAKQYKWEKDFEDIEIKLIVVFVGISIFFGVLFLIIHMFFKELRNRGGIFFMFLAANVLITDCLFFMCSTNYKVIAILLHFSLLSVNVWTTVLVIDICWTFTRRQIENAQSTTSSKMTFWKAVAVYSISLLIVGVCVVLDETDTIRFGYGQNSVCWMTQYYPRLVAYTIPVLTTYVICFVCLVFLLCHLRKQKSDSKRASQSSGRPEISLIKIALKLVIILGVVEILGFVQIPKTNLTENETKVNVVFGLLYNVTRSLRNTLIFFVVLFNKRTQRLYKNKMQHRRGNETTKITNVKSTPVSKHKLKILN